MTATGASRTTTTATKVRKMGKATVVVAVLGAMVLASLFGGALALGLGALSQTQAAPHALPASPHANLPVSAAATGSGLGLLNNTAYFVNSRLPFDAVGNRTCDPPTATGVCPASQRLNVTNDPSMVMTGGGTLAVAYTSMTNASPCAGARPYAVTNVAFTTSTDQGATWSTPQYLGDANCTTAGKYPSAWEPTLAVLGNGTLAMAYVAYNLTNANLTGGSLPPYLNPASVPVSELLFTESYDNGATWTAPQVLNVSVNTAFYGVYFAPGQPTMAAYGQTIYLAWERIGEWNANPMQNSQIALLVSTTGGATWSPTIPITSGYSWSYDPALTVSSAGTVFLAYDQSYCTFCGANVVVESSAYNGTVFSMSTLPGSFSPPLLLGDAQQGGAFAGPILHLAWSEKYGQLFVAFSAWGYTSNFYYTPVLYLFNSPDNGTSWSQSFSANGALYDPASSPNTLMDDNRYDPGVYDTAIAADSNGSLYVAGLVRNASLCRLGQCSNMEEVVTVTSDNGTTFAPPTQVQGDVTPGNGSWAGETTSALVGGNQLYVAYPQESCPAWPSVNCTSYPGTSQEQSQVTVATPYRGAGTTMTFVPQGLNASLNWTVWFMGKTYSANGLTSIQVTGVPTGQVMEWIVTGVNATGTLRFYVQSQSADSLSPIVASETDHIVFERFYPLGLFVGGPGGSILGQQCGYDYIYNDQGSQSLYECTSPISPNCWLQTGNYSSAVYTYWDLYYTVYCANLAVNAPVGLDQIAWLPAGSHVTLTASSSNYISTVTSGSGPCQVPGWVPSGYYVFADCTFQTTNVSFVSWTGTGNASVSSNQSSISLTMNGPANETLNIVAVGSCNGFAYWSGTYRYWYMNCQQDQAQLNIIEHGLPNTVEWGATLTNTTGSLTYMNSAPGSLSVGPLPLGVTYSVSAWTIPSTPTGTFWVPTIVTGSTIITGFSGSTIVNYASRSSLAGLSFNVTLNESGLPAGSNWYYTVANPSLGLNQTLGAHGNTSFEQLWSAATGSYTVGGLSVYNANSTSYYVSEVIVTVHTINVSTMVSSGSATFSLTGDANITVVYAPEYWLEVSATTGGSATPQSQWVPAGARVTLTATADTGNYFVGWTGTGPGATGSSQRHATTVTIRPLGPVTELAVFAATPPPTYTATVESSGLPATQSFTVLLGGLAYSGVGSFTVTNLSAGGYTLSVPVVYDNVTVGTRYVPGTPTVTPWTLAGSDYLINSNGTIQVNYATEYLLSLNATAGGRVSPWVGSAWESASSTLTITAVPSPGYHFGSWAGTGAGSVNSTQITLTVSVLGAMSETAQFVKNPPAPAAVYALTVTETGLPSGTSWNATLSSGGGTFGTSASLVLGGLNGSYTLTVPTVTMGPGVRYVPTGTGNYTVPVTANTSYPVTFTEQYLVVVSSAGSGTLTVGTTGVTGVYSAWVTAGTTVSLSASANASWQFANWTGSGSGAYTGSSASTSFVVNGPVSEVAAFGPQAKSTVSSSNSSTSGLPLALGLLVGLLLAGLAVGALLAMRRKRSPPPSDMWEPEPSGEASSTESPGSGGSS
jgi:hypothetical protein